MNLKDEVLVSSLIYQDNVLTPEQIMKALINGKKIKVKKAPKGHNFYLEDGELKSDKITYLKGLPITWFNPDIKYVIDYD